MGLGKWFGERWVDLSRPKEGGGFEACGRSEAERRAYPKCVPASRAARMTAKQIQSAIRRKRKALSGESLSKPTAVSTLVKLRRAKGGK